MMLLKMIDCGNTIEYSTQRIERLVNTDNVIVIGKGIKAILTSKEIRNYLMRKYAINDELYLVSPDNMNEEENYLVAYLVNPSFNITGENVLKVIDVHDHIRVVAERVKKVETL